MNLYDRGEVCNIIAYIRSKLDVNYNSPFAMGVTLRSSEAQTLADAYETLRREANDACAREESAFDRGIAYAEGLFKPWRLELERERDEAREAYAVLVGLLRKRFPQRADGSMPDFKVEDVLSDNTRLREALESMEHQSQCSWCIANMGIRVAALAQGKEES